MIDKSLVKKRFSKSYNSYEDNAFIQNNMADKLINFLGIKKFNSIFEIGCATGLLTKKIKNNFVFNSFYGNDIVYESKNYIRTIIPDCIFLEGDIEELEINNKFDLIISNASLQWCNNINGIIEKLYNSLNNNGILAISIFGDSNLKEIKDIFNIKNNYNIENVKDNLKNYPIKLIFEEEIKLNFNSLIEILQHFKNTGVNAISEIKLTKNKIKHLEEKYKEQYIENGKLTLTYTPLYIIIKK